MKFDWKEKEIISTNLGENEYAVEYSQPTGRYRVSFFQNNHYQGDVIFNDMSIEKNNAYCPICQTERFIPNPIGYCCVCGHHLNQLEDRL